METAEISKELRQPYRMAINRLDDVYKCGRILGKNLKIYPHPSEQFMLFINEYIDLIEQSGNYSPTEMRILYELSVTETPVKWAFLPKSSYKSRVRIKSATFFHRSG